MALLEKISISFLARGKKIIRNGIGDQPVDLFGHPSVKTS